MIYQVYDKDDLKYCLSLCRHGDVIDGQGVSIHVGHARWRVSKRISMRNLNIVGIGSHFKKMDEKFSFLEVIHGGGLEMETVTMEGDRQQGEMSCFVKGKNAKWVVAQDCEFRYAKTMSLWSYECDLMLLNSCKITMNNPTSYGYGVWIGGRGKILNDQLTVKDSRIEGCRHGVAGSYHQNHILVENCIFGHHVKHIIDRHSGTYDINAPQFGVGGGSYTIIDNRFLDPDRRAIKIPIPLDNYRAEITGNHFAKERGKCVTIEVNEGGQKKEYDDDTIDHPQIAIDNNTYI